MMMVRDGNTEAEERSFTRAAREVDVESAIPIATEHKMSTESSQHIPSVADVVSIEASGSVTSALNKDEIETDDVQIDLALDGM
jgi:hypothetical protein